MAQWRVKETAGPIVREMICPHVMPQDGPRMRAEKSKLTTPARQLMNDKTSRAKFRMLLYANYKRGDCFVTLTYDDAHKPETVEEANKLLRKYNDTLREARKRRGTKYKYAYVTETGRGKGRIHHHLIMNASKLGTDEIKSLWPYGDVNIRYLWDSFESIAEYMTKEGMEGRKVGAQMWTTSKNLVRPERVSGYEKDGVTIVPPPGVYIINKVEKVTEYGLMVFLEYRTDGKPHTPFIDGDFDLPPLPATA